MWWYMAVKTEPKAGRWRVQSQLGLHNESPPQEKKNRTQDIQRPNSKEDSG